MQDERQTLLQLSQFVFDREAKEARERLHETIVETIFYLNRSLDSIAAKHEIEEHLKLKFDQTIVDACIANLVSNKFLEQDVRSGKLYLTATRRKQLQDMIADRKKALDIIEKKVVSTYRKNVKHSDEQQENVALGFFYHVCVRLFSSNSDLLLGILGCTDKQTEFIRRYRSPEKVVDETLDTITDQEKHQALRKAIVKVLTDENFLESLAGIARNFLYFQILNLDPQCKSLQKEIFAKKVILLDTNFIMSLLLPSSITHKAAIQCLNVSKKLGIEFRYTKRTVEEFLKQLDQSRKRFKEVGTLRPEVMAALDDDFIASFAVQKSTNQATNWVEYCNWLQGVKGALLRLGISEYSSIQLDFEVANIDSKGEVLGYVMTCAQSLSGNIKNVTVAEHDAYHLLLVRKLREGSVPEGIGPRFWFLTFDKSLLCVDEGINKVLGLDKELPSSIECWVWLETILPFLTGQVQEGTTHEAFAQLMRTEFSVLPSTISVGKLVEIQTPKIDFSQYTIAEIRAILDDDFVNEYWHKLRQAIMTHSPQAKVYKEKLQKRAEVVADTIRDRKVTLELRVRYASAATSLAVIALAALCAVIDKYAGTIILGFLAIVLMAMALGYRKFKMVFKKLGIDIGK